MRRTVYITGRWHAEQCPAKGVEAKVVRVLRPDKSLYLLMTHTAEAHAMLLGWLFKECDRPGGAVIGIFNHEPPLDFIR